MRNLASTVIAAVFFAAVIAAIVIACGAPLAVIGS